MIIATAGHVDHGKSLLVKNLTGVDPDRWVEEKQRGLTIDLGFAYTRLPTAAGTTIELGFVDVPGHIKFISNMLAGVSTIDMAFLVIAADDGPMPQTREHLAILSLLGVKKIVGVITKIDKVDSQRVSLVTEATRALLANAGHPSTEIIPISNISGDGLDNLKAQLLTQAENMVARRDDHDFRLAIDRVFTVKGAGTVVTGSVFSGKVSVGDELTLLPHRRPVRVRGIHRQNLSADHGTAGDRCAINITGNQLDATEIHRGNWLAANAEAPLSDRMDAELHVLSSEKKALRHWTSTHVHLGANHIQARVATLESDHIEPGSTGLIQLVFEEPVNAWFGDRFILRDQAATRTIGGGHIISPSSPKRGRQKSERLALLRNLNQSSHNEVLTNVLKTRPGGINFATFCAERNLTNTQVSELRSSCPAVFIDGSQWVLAKEHEQKLSQQILADLQSWHADNPHQKGIALGKLLLNIKPTPPADVLSHLLQQISSEVVINAGIARIKSVLPELSPGLEKLWQQLKPILEADPLKPPVIHELAGKLRTTPKALEKQLSELTGHNYLKRPVNNRFFLASALNELQARVQQLAENSQDGEFSAADYRDVTGVGRNLAIELLEFFDRSGVTYRVGDKRKLR